MALTESGMMPLGKKAPAFKLPDTVSGRTLSLADIKGKKGAVVMFICNHCPFVKHLYPALARLGQDYRGAGIGIAAISANDVNQYPEDGPEQMKAMAESLGLVFPYLYDESQAVAKAYGATCTPDFFLFDRSLACVYRGQFDDSRPSNNKPITGADLRGAMDALVNKEQVSMVQKPSIGCGIKWKA
ncbi:thioredoxin family protein [Kistimonas asteriae]|uniref:thioredoxin family protein n=1 Tax=Kistimonas asteriae TaxID=517724 RepID=UPI001BA990D9|nr:thioredoxin family protein [Kistimonas asteriae]